MYKKGLTLDKTSFNIGCEGTKRPMIGGVIMRSNLRHVRLQKGFNDVEKLAEKIGISASYYYKIEQGVRTPNINLAKKIADTLGHAVDDLFFNKNMDELSNEGLEQKVI